MIAERIHPRKRVVNPDGTPTAFFSQLFNEHLSALQDALITAAIDAAAVLAERVDTLEQQVQALTAQLADTVQQASVENVVAQMQSRDVVVRSLAVNDYLYARPGSVTNLFDATTFAPPTSYDPGAADPGPPGAEYMLVATP